jgi:hypothetical protein
MDTVTAAAQVARDHAHRFLAEHAEVAVENGATDRKRSRRRGKSRALQIAASLGHGDQHDAGDRSQQCTQHDRSTRSSRWTFIPMLDIGSRSKADLQTNQQRDRQHEQRFLQHDPSRHVSRGDEHDQTQIRSAAISQRPNDNTQTMQASVAIIFARASRRWTHELGGQLVGRRKSRPGEDRGGGHELSAVLDDRSTRRRPAGPA